jgi:hypothetical protein
VVRVLVHRKRTVGVTHVVGVVPVAASDDPHAVLARLEVP